MADPDASPISAAAERQPGPAAPRDAAPPDADPDEGPAADRKDAVPAFRSDRPARPPVVAATADVIARTRPARLQIMAERCWTGAALVAFLGVVTALITHNAAVDALAAEVSTNDPEETRRQAARILHFAAVGIMALGVAAEAVLVALMRRRTVLLRIGLTVVALSSAVLLPWAVEILGVAGWRGLVIRFCLIAHVALAAVGSVLMWLPIGRRTAP